MEQIRRFIDKTTELLITVSTDLRKLRKSHSQLEQQVRELQDRVTTLEEDRV